MRDIHWLVTEDNIPVRRATTTEAENGEPLTLPVRCQGSGHFIQVRPVTLEDLNLTDDHAAFQAKLFGHNNNNNS